MTKKESRDDNLVSDFSIPEKTDDVMPQLNGDFACKHTNLMSAETTMNTSDVDEDFQSHSTSSSEQQIPNVQPWSNDTAR